MSFRLAGTLFALALLVGGAALVVASARAPELWKRLPRERVVGGALGLMALLWSAWLVEPLLEGGLASLRPWLVPVALVVGIAGAFLLDYVLTRALGGLLLLVVNAIMHLAFVAQAPWRGTVSVVCYALGLAGLFMIGAPYRFRDVLEACCRSPRARWALGAALGLAGVVTGAIAQAAHG